MRLLSRLTVKESWELLRAAPTVCRYRATLRWVPFRDLARRALRPPAQVDVAPRARAELAELSRAVSATAALLKGTTTCLVQALALVDLARRRGIPAELCIGVTHSEGESEVGIDGHAWVELEGEVVHGASERDYRRFSSFEAIVATLPR